MFSLLCRICAQLTQASQGRHLPDCKCFCPELVKQPTVVDVLRCGFDMESSEYIRNYQCCTQVPFQQTLLTPQPDALPPTYLKEWTELPSKLATAEHSLRFRRAAMRRKRLTWSTFTMFSPTVRRLSNIGRCFLCLIAIQCPLCSSPCAANLMILMHFERREDFRKQWIHRRPRPGRCRSCCSEILQDFGRMAPCFATVSSSNMRYLQTLHITELQRSSMDGCNIRTYVITQYISI
jgi:hypothetical protein